MSLVSMITLHLSVISFLNLYSKSVLMPCWLTSSASGILWIIKLFWRNCQSFSWFIKVGLFVDRILLGMTVLWDLFQYFQWLQKQSSEVLYKKLSLKTYQNSQLKTCDGVSFWYSCGPATLLKKESNTGVFLSILRDF